MSAVNTYVLIKIGLQFPKPTGNFSISLVEANGPVKAKFRSKSGKNISTPTLYLQFIDCTIFSLRNNFFSTILLECQGEFAIKTRLQKCIFYIKNYVQLFLLSMSGINMTEEYLNDTQLAKLLGISLQALRNKISANNPLPPRIEPPGCKHRLWMTSEVENWLHQFIIKENFSGESTGLNQGQQKRRGRPRSIGSDKLA
jgi:predicted DNA-binding transcriptional regulator AlpA